MLTLTIIQNTTEILIIPFNNKKKKIGTLSRFKSEQDRAIGYINPKHTLLMH